MQKPSEKPINKCYASGACAKRPGWQFPENVLFGRSHRSNAGLSLIQDVIRLQKEVLEIPDDYFLGIIDGSSTGAMETLIWSLLGARGVDVLAHCIFSNHWAYDIKNELRLEDVRIIKADFPAMADTASIDSARDLVFCWTSTTSGVSFRNAEWIKDDRSGLAICDAASAAFATKIDWKKLDAVAFSWQKGLGGEAGFGSIVLSPRAISRLETYKPAWPIPRIFRIANDRKVNFNLFQGHTINTPSMICLKDFYDNLLWAKSIGGMNELLNRVNRNYEAAQNWIAQQSVFQFLADEKYRARHIACLDIKTDKYQSLNEAQKWEFLKKMTAICEEEDVGFDILGHIATKPHLRVWMGATIESEDLQKFFPWLEWAYYQACE
jgi:phosphoserine aminotransferase